MPQRVLHLVTDFCQLAIVYGVAIFISFQKFSYEFYVLGEFIKYLSFALAGGYTAWKWYNENKALKLKRNGK
jgi:hypothetical protein